MQQDDKAAKAWSGRFNEPLDRLAQRFNASVDFDKRLAAFDIEGSLAHARMLARVGILPAADLADIERGMGQIAKEVHDGTFPWTIEREDVHLNIEARLTDLVGDAGKRLHTARSRNDQVATDIRLWLRSEIDALTGVLKTLRGRLLDSAEADASTLMPGFTHLQVAQPVTFGHHLMAYYEMFTRDAARLADCRKRVNRLPLGASALAGTSYPIDRESVAKELGFDGVCENSLDAVSDRDFAVEFLAAAALMQAHVSRFAEELILWSNPRFGFVELADRFCTGSSIMPQKKNPDVPELMRGKTGRVYGSLFAMLTIIKGQPLAYNKDNQEDKEPLFDTADTLRDVLTLLAELLGGLKARPDRMMAALAEGHATATDLADYLVRKGLPFRDAHEVVARAVREAVKLGKELPALPLATLKSFSPLVGDDVFAVLTPEGSVASRSHIGGTAPSAVKAAIARARKAL
ncbi:Argininosuccinate lyase [Usitatibacter rugosus]|uniref:Argininosuccinate lyase n=1 Tax=Usitatibacter rugosus TaxID=2732067 RepID=A0A6M4H0P4_9PROT|nr:argininosuccinate lyase [Usitatibacter rugosus]QJR13076.1 Argininosuccinate lyase [Usitatibacter rugosus]